MLLALLQEGAIRSRGIMPLSFVELCALIQTSTLFIMHSDIITQLNFALSQEDILIFLSYLLKCHSIFIEKHLKIQVLPLITL